MHRYPFVTPRQALVILRIAVSLILAAHGVMRLYMASVNDFGVWLNTKGFLVGPFIAWFLTIFEIVGGLTMAAGFFTRWIATVLLVEIAMGIILVHAQNGWFTVGHQSGGMEYSVLLIICLLVIAATAPRKEETDGQPHNN